jgi:adenylate cyclase 10
LLDRATKERKVPLKAGYILKRSEKGVFWDYRFCSLDSENFKIYSIDNEEEVVGDSSIVLPLTKLQEITILQNPTGMAIASSCWYKRNILVEAYRRFQFAFDDEEEQIEWTTFLDFAKTYVPP